MANRSKDWLSQAVRDLNCAKEIQKRGWHEWACFVAQQSAEKAVKALHLSLGQEAWGHVIGKLLKELPFKISNGLIDKAKILDAHYIPARYANGHPEGAPFEHYGPIQSREAIKYAGEILKFVRKKVAAKRKS